MKFLFKKTRCDEKQSEGTLVQPRESHVGCKCEKSSRLLFTQLGVVLTAVQRKQNKRREGEQ